ncbi:MAG: hypothetical protein GX941_00220 [Candidatus Methanofastidiosa archaeon]|mgnify:CR=1 FL=1|nr:hypothetical protein [Candidatus Methanofastidiosa archaeon]
MRKNRVKIILILTILILCTIPSIYSDSSDENYMLSLINNERLGHGLKPLAINPSLASAARSHSQDMIDRGFFSHVNPDGLTPSDRARNAGYSFTALAENICGNPSIDAGHSSLMNSPTHRANILNPSYSEIGIGIINGGPYGKMITQLFGAQLEHNVIPRDTAIPNELHEKPDLKFSTIEVTGEYRPHKQLLTKMIVTNSGKKNAGSFILAVFNGPPESGNQLKTISIPSLYVGQSSSIYFSWTPQNEGNFTLYFVLDYANNIDEENENNNIWIYNVSIKSTNTYPAQKESLNNTLTSTINNLPDLYIPKSPNSIINENDSQINQKVDLIIYPYYINIDEQENGLFEIKAKIKNKSNSKTENFSVTFYEIDVNSSLLEKIYMSLNPGEIVEKFIYFIPTSAAGEVLVIIDEENIINEVDKSNNFAYKKFFKTEKLENTYDTNANLITNTTPEEAVVSDLFKITMRINDTNSSNVYLYYKYEDANDSFYIVKMNDEGNGAYSYNMDFLGKEMLFYYFEVDTEYSIIKSPSESPKNLYSIRVQYKETTQDKKDKNIIENMKRIFKLIQ